MIILTLVNFDEVPQGVPPLPIFRGEVPSPWGDGVYSSLIRIHPRPHRSGLWPKRSG